MVSALLEFAFVVLLSRMTNTVKKNLHDCTRENEKFSITERLRRRKTASKENCTIDRWEKDEVQLKDRNNMYFVSNMPPIHVVDFLSFCIYVFLFILFNAIYWISYQM